MLISDYDSERGTTRLISLVVLSILNDPPHYNT
ncbi:unnamed protein product, partial [marine sediment metagenome]